MVNTNSIEERKSEADKTSLEFFQSKLQLLKNSSKRMIEEILQWAPTDAACVRTFIQALAATIEEAPAIPALALLHLYDALVNEKGIYLEMGVGQGAESWLIKVYDKLKGKHKVDPIKELWKYWSSQRGLPPVVVSFLEKQLKIREPTWFEPPNKPQKRPLIAENNEIKKVKVLYNGETTKIFYWLIHI